MLNKDVHLPGKQKLSTAWIKECDRHVDRHHSHIRSLAARRFRRKSIFQNPQNWQLGSHFNRDRYNFSYFETT